VSKYLLILTCRECGFVTEKPDYSLKWGKRYCCEKLNREVDPDTIDPDCGLPDYEEADVRQSLNQREIDEIASYYDESEADKC
jgi:hypothetical protein